MGAWRAGLPQSEHGRRYIDSRQMVPDGYHSARCRKPPPLKRRGLSLVMRRGRASDRDLADARQAFGHTSAHADEIVLIELVLHDVHVFVNPLDVIKSVSSRVVP